jgi:pilus assembly protein CpaF
MNTGHDGSAATVHSNSPDACVGRIANLVLQAGFELPDRAIKEIIAEAVDIVIQISRLRDGSRKITHITEVTHYDLSKGKVITNDIYLWKLTGVKDGKLQGKMEYTGYVPSQNLLDKFERHNINFDELVKGEE